MPHNATQGLSGYSMVLPLLPARSDAPGGAAVDGGIFGTCFSIGGPFMLTAGHVAATAPFEANRRLIAAIQTPDGMAFKAAEVVQCEQLTADIGLLKVQFHYPESASWIRRLAWSERHLLPFEVVRTAGYPYGLHITEEHGNALVVRGFQGQVVASIQHFKPQGMKGPLFAIYELSFMAPRGLSGAPLMNANGVPVVHGVVIGNSESKMLVFRSEERETEKEESEQEKKEKTSSFEQYEALSLGIAVTAAQVFALESKMLGGTVRQHLSTQGLLQA